MNGMLAPDDLFRQRVDEALMAFGARDSLGDRALVVAAGLQALGREIARLLRVAARTGGEVGRSVRVMTAGTRDGVGADEGMGRLDRSLLHDLHVAAFGALLRPGLLRQNRILRPVDRMTVDARDLSAPMRALEPLAACVVSMTFETRAISSRPGRRVVVPGEPDVADVHRKPDVGGAGAMAALALLPGGGCLRARAFLHVRRLEDRLDAVGLMTAQTGLEASVRELLVRCGAPRAPILPGPVDLSERRFDEGERKKKKGRLERPDCEEAAASHLGISEGRMFDGPHAPVSEGLSVASGGRAASAPGGAAREVIPRGRLWAMPLWQSTQVLPFESAGP